MNSVQDSDLRFSHIVCIILGNRNLRSATTSLCSDRMNLWRWVERGILQYGWILNFCLVIVDFVTLLEVRVLVQKMNSKFRNSNCGD